MSVDAAGFTRVVVVAPSTRVDVALPSDLALVELLPTLLDMVGERSDDGGAPHDGWQLLDVGGRALDRSRGLRALGVLDGSSLQLSPTRPTSTEPVYDDVVDAIAAAARARQPEADLRETGGAVAVTAALLATAGVLLSAGSSVVTAGLAALSALISLAAATLVRRSGLSVPVSVATAAGGAALATVAGVLAVPGPVTGATALLAGVALAVYVTVAGMLLGTGAMVFSGLAAVGVAGALGGVVALLWDQPLSTYLVIVGTLALAAMTVTPWLAVRLSRLPMPVIPTTPDHLQDDELSPDGEVVARHAVVAGEYLDGLVLGCTLLAAVGAAAALLDPRLVTVGYAATVIAVLLLRMRTLRGRRQRLSLLLGGVGGAVVGVVAAAWGPATSMAVPLAVLGLVLAAAAVTVTVTAGRRRANPMARRSVDIVENILLVAVLPLAVGAIDLYTTVRRL